MFVENDIKYKGYYKVGDLKFTSKTAAIYESNRSNTQIEWIYHNDVWDKFHINNNRQLSGNKCLKYLYRDRAQQLRDSYDYLILYYSGGADSHNVLMTFLNNGIKLDEIFSRRHDSIDSKIYTPNNQDTSMSNFLSEWDYTARPTLKWVSRAYPNIKITTSNMFDTPIEKAIGEDFFAKAGNWYTFINAYRMCAKSPNESVIRLHGRSIANIICNDKPLIYKSGNRCYMTFSDIGVPILAHEIANKESFYWSPDMPSLLFEQAYQIYEYFLSNPKQQFMIEKDSLIHGNNLLSNNRREILKKILYKDTWDFNRFQTIQPDIKMLGNKKYLVLPHDMPYLKYEEFRKIYDRWLFYFNNYDILHKNELTPKYCNTKSWLLGEF